MYIQKGLRLITQVKNFLKFFEIQLIYNVVLISAVQQSDMYILLHILFHYHRILNMAPCDIQWDLAVYPSCV